MGLFSWLNTRKSEGTAPPQTKMSDGAIVIDVAGVRNNGALDTDTMLKIEAVFACLRDKSETIGQIPLRMYQKTGENSRIPVTSGRNHRIFTQKPCDYMTMQQFMEMLVVSLERFGAFYAYVDRNDRGNVMSITPFRFQNNVRPQMDVNGNVYYIYMKNDGTQGNPYRLEDLFIVKGFTLDGYTPVAPMVQTATNLGIANTQEQSVKETQEKGITAQMALSTEQVFSDANARQRIQDDWDKFRGPSGKNTIPILEQGLKPVSLKLTPAETELLDNRKFTIDRICRTFRVPLHRVGIAEGGKMSGNLFDMDEAYMRDALNPILVKVETALTELTQTGVTLSFDRNAFYSGSPWRLLAHVEKGVKGGLLTINHGRVILGWEPVEGGDVFAIDNNNVVYGFWNELESMQERLYGPKQPAKPVNEDNTNVQ